LAKNCIEVGPAKTLEETVHQGSVLYFDEPQDQDYLLNLETGKQTFLPRKWIGKSIFFGGMVSPNRSRLVYVEVKQFEGSQIWVVNSQGTVVRSTLDHKEWAYGDWINDQAIEFFLIDPNMPGSEVLYNPETGEQTVIRPTFTNLFDTSSPDYKGIAWQMKYSPDHSRVVYVSEPLGVTVWDTLQKKVIWQHETKPDIFSFQNIPYWSPLGDQVAVVIEGQLYLIGLQGEQTTLPDIGDLPQIKIRKFAWSPDGKEIAFWATDSYPFGPPMKFYIWDLESGQVIDFCIQSTQLSAELIWSPDGQYVITNFVNQPNDGSVILIDRINHQIDRLSKNPVAWMR
jgi:WD40 repeat protein